MQMRPCRLDQPPANAAYGDLHQVRHQRADRAEGESQILATGVKPGKRPKRRSGAAFRAGVNRKTRLHRHFRSGRFRDVLPRHSSVHGGITSQDRFGGACGLRWCDYRLCFLQWRSFAGHWVYQGGKATNWQNGGVHGAPGPIAGAGLPVLAVGYGVYWLVRRPILSARDTEGLTLAELTGPGSGSPAGVCPQ
jgi:hypothetical protein